MNMKEIAALYGIKEVDKSMKNKTKAKDIVEKILKCPKCGKPMHWVKDTNVCVCQTCTYTVGKKENKKTYSITKPLSNRDYKFLVNNYDSINTESTEV